MKPDRLALMQALVDENKLEWAPMNHGGGRKQAEGTWPIMFECLRMYCEERQAEAPGTEVSSIPENLKWTHPDGHEVGLGRWMHTQNKLRRAGKLRPDRCAKVQELVDAGVFRWPTLRQAKGGSGANNGGESSGGEDDDDDDGTAVGGIKRAGVGGGGDESRLKRARTSSQRESINPCIDLDAMILPDAWGSGEPNMDHLLYADASWGRGKGMGKGKGKGKGKGRGKAADRFTPPPLSTRSSCRSLPALGQSGPIEPPQPPGIIVTVPECGTYYALTFPLPGTEGGGVGGDASASVPQFWRICTRTLGEAIFVLGLPPTTNRRLLVVSALLKGIAGFSASVERAGAGGQAVWDSNSSIVPSEVQYVRDLVSTHLSTVPEGKTYYAFTFPLPWTEGGGVGVGSSSVRQFGRICTQTLAEAIFVLGLPPTTNPRLFALLKGIAGFSASVEAAGAGGQVVFNPKSHAIPPEVHHVRFLVSTHLSTVPEGKTYYAFTFPLPGTEGGGVGGDASASVPQFWRICTQTLAEAIFVLGLPPTTNPRLLAVSELVKQIAGFSASVERAGAGGQVVWDARSRIIPSEVQYVRDLVATYLDTARRATPSPLTSAQISRAAARTELVTSNGGILIISLGETLRLAPVPCLTLEHAAWQLALEVIRDKYVGGGEEDSGERPSEEERLAETAVLARRLPPIIMVHLLANQNATAVRKPLFKNVVQFGNEALPLPAQMPLAATYVGYGSFIHSVNENQVLYSPDENTPENAALDAAVKAAIAAHKSTSSAVLPKPLLPVYEAYVAGARSTLDAAAVGSENAVSNPELNDMFLEAMARHT